MKKNADHFQTELKTVTAKIAELVIKCSEIESNPAPTDTEYAEYEKLSQELAAFKERQNRILMLIHAN